MEFLYQLIRYSRACSSYECFVLRARRLSSKLLKQGYLAERLKSSFRKFYGRYGDLIQQYEVSLSRMLNDILILDQQWLPNQSDFPPISWPWYRAWPSPSMSGFHGAFAAGVACQQGTLILPDTWFRPPFWDLLMLQLLRPNSSNLPCLYSTFHLEYPLVLSRFCSHTNRKLKEKRHQKQNRSTQGCSKLKRSVDMTSSRKNGFNIRKNASPKWNRARCPE